MNEKKENNVVEHQISKYNNYQMNQKIDKKTDININKDKNIKFPLGASPLNKNKNNQINHNININKNNNIPNNNINKNNITNNNIPKYNISNNNIPKNNNTNNNSPINNILKVNNTSEKKKIIAKSEESSNQENINDSGSESKIIIEEENSEREPQDNCKKRIIKTDLPNDTDDLYYKESQIQYDNLSLDSKNNANNRSDKKETKKSNLSNSNNDKISENNNIINEEEITNSLNNISNNYQNKIIDSKIDLNNNINNKSNEKIIDLNNNINDNINVSNIKNEKFINYLDKDLELNRPKYKKNIIKLNINNNKKANMNNIYQKKEINKNKNLVLQKKPIMKILTIKNKNINKNNNDNFNSIDKRSNSSGNRNNKNNKYNINSNKIKYPGERLYENYMKKLPKKMEKNQKILMERMKEENKELLLKPKIDENSEKIIKRLRSNDDKNERVEERLINYGNNKRQKHLIQYVNKDLQNQVKNPYSPHINKTSREIAEKNKQNRITETANFLEGKKSKNSSKKISLDKEFGKRNRSIGDEHKNANSFINFDESKNLSNKAKNSNKRHSNLNSDSNYSNNLNSYRNSRPDNNITDENNPYLSPLNKTFDLNNAYKELYNSIDEKMDSDLTKFFGTNGELNSNLTENNVKKNSKIKEKKNKNTFHERSLTPNSYIKNYQKYNTFDYLYYESENLGKKDKNKKRLELNFKRNHPFKPKISPYAQKMKNKKESTNEFINRMSKNLEEIKKVNSKSKLNNQNDLNRNSKNDDNNNFRPRISRGPKNINQRNITVNLEGFYDKRITKEKKELLQSKKEDEEEKKILYNQKSKDIIIKMKIKKYKELFSLLDSDNDGLISAEKIQLTKVEENVLKNIAPILEELNQTKKEINFKEFCIKLDKLMTEESQNNQENKK